MKTKILMAAVTIASLTSLIGCGGQQHTYGEMGTSLSASQVIAGAKSQEDAAEKLALAGEKLVAGPGFIYADELFDMALERDPRNVRARFYSAALRPVMLNKGILKRIQPLVDRLSPQKQKEYKGNVADISEDMVREFYTDGKEDIASETKLQNLLHFQVSELKKSRHVIEELGKEKFTIHWAPYNSTSLQKCRITRVAAGEYKTKNCTVNEHRDYVLNFADWTALKISIAASEIYFGEFTLFDAQGSLDALKRINFKEDPTDKEATDAIKAEPTLGQAIDGDTFQTIKELGPDAAEAFKLAYEDKHSLCKMGYGSDYNRPLNLFSHGLCVPSKVMQIVPLINSSLTRSTMMPFYNQSNQTKPSLVTEVNASSILNGSIADLRSQLPTQFDACGNGTNIGDKTLGGLFPRGDALEVLKIDATPDTIPFKRCSSRK